MLPHFIIDQIRQREKEERARQDAARPRLERPLRPPGRAPRDVAEESPPEDEGDRGVVILQM